MYVKYSMDDILHDDILLFSFYFVLISIFKTNHFVITRGQDEVTTERARECFSFFLSWVRGNFS